MIRIFNENCLDLVGSQCFEDLTKGRKVCIVTDPPFNVGYKYNEYKDNMEDDEYYSFLGGVLTTHGFPFVVIHYPEAIYKISFQTGLFPERVVSWVYNSNTARQHRDVAFFGIKPDFSLIRQPYKNPSDKRIAARIANGEEGSRLYDWWEVNQTKNVWKVRGGGYPSVRNANRGDEENRWDTSCRLRHLRPVHGFGDNGHCLPDSREGLHRLRDRRNLLRGGKEKAGGTNVGANGIVLKGNVMKLKLPSARESEKGERYARANGLVQRLVREA